MTDKNTAALAADHTERHLDMVGRWYMVNKMGMATLCVEKEDAENEAADAQRFWPHMGPHRAVRLVEASFEAADMATAAADGFRAGQDACFQPADMAAAAAQGFMDGVASLAANAGGLVVNRATVIEWLDANDIEVTDRQLGGLFHFSAPPTAQAEGWTRLPGALPEPGTPVLLAIGTKYPIRAMWAAKHTVQSANDDTEWGEYVEEDDMYYAPEGWYEWNQCEDTHWRVTETPRAWMPLPAPPTSAEGVEHG